MPEGNYHDFPIERIKVKPKYKAGFVKCPHEKCVDGKITIIDIDNIENKFTCDVCAGDGNVSIESAYDFILKSERNLRESCRFISEEREKAVQNTEKYETILQMTVDYIGKGYPDTLDKIIELISKEFGKKPKRPRNVIA